jgi:hypothetical protein
MKLSSQKLSALLREELREMGYIEFKDRFRVSNCLFIKPLAEDFYLSLGLTISRFYENRFTADFYLSKVTVWAAMWGDIPSSCYKRIGHFLNKDERHKYLGPEYCNPGNMDAWWSPLESNWESHFLEVIRITEGRFINTPNLLLEIAQSEEVNEMFQDSSSVRELVCSKDDVEELNLTKGTSIISEEWLNAAEIVLKRKNGLLNKNLINRLAADAWRQCYLQKLSPPLQFLSPASS